jgi:hypothetical protein
MYYYPLFSLRAVTILWLPSYVYRFWRLGATWGSQSWLQPPFRRPLWFMSETSVLQQQDMSVVEHGAASKGSWSR